MTQVTAVFNTNTPVPIVVGVAGPQGVQGNTGLTGPMFTSTSIGYSTNITPSLPASGANLILNVGTITGPLTIATPTNLAPVDGQEINFRFSFSATPFTVTFNNYSFSSDLPASLLPTGAPANWEMMARWTAPNSTWRILAIARGF